MQPAGFIQRSPECTFFYIPSPFFSLRALTVQVSALMLCEQMLNEKW